MRIKYVRIMNYKNLENFEMDFEEPSPILNII
jgi:hypothetical protein